MIDFSFLDSIPLEKIPRYGFSHFFLPHIRVAMTQLGVDMDLLEPAGVILPPGLLLLVWTKLNVSVIRLYAALCVLENPARSFGPLTPFPYGGLSEDEREACERLSAGRREELARLHGEANARMARLLVKFAHFYRMLFSTPDCAAVCPLVSMVERYFTDAETTEYSGAFYEDLKTFYDEPTEESMGQLYEDVDDMSDGLDSLYYFLHQSMGMLAQYRPFYVEGGRRLADVFLSVAPSRCPRPLPADYDFARPLTLAWLRDVEGVRVNAASPRGWRESTPLLSSGLSLPPASAEVTSAEVRPSSSAEVTSTEVTSAEVISAGGSSADEVVESLRSAAAEGTGRKARDIPSRLLKSDATECWRKLVAQGYCRQEDDHYLWKGSTREFAFMVSLASKRFKFYSPDDRRMLLWDGFLALFRLERGTKNSAQVQWNKWKQGMRSSLASQEMRKLKQIF